MRILYDSVGRVGLNRMAIREACREERGRNRRPSFPSHPGFDFGPGRSSSKRRGALNDLGMLEMKNPPSDEPGGFANWRRRREAGRRG